MMIVERFSFVKLHDRPLKPVVLEKYARSWSIAMYLGGIKGSAQDIKMNSSIIDDHIWVAVRVERGFVTEIVAFTNENAARHVEASWRREMNPDYDEVAVKCIRVFGPTRC